MTTSSGKPPLDEQDRDSGWDSAGEGAASSDGSPSSGEPPTPRQVTRVEAAPSEDEAAPIYGTGVPYGGDDRTEEIEPIALDMPFSKDERKGRANSSPAASAAAIAAGAGASQASATSAAPTTSSAAALFAGSTPASPPIRPNASALPRAPFVAFRDFEMKAPVTQLVLSDLFDSTPPPGSMAPPDPAAFSSSRPAPAEGSSASLMPYSAAAVVALPSIDITAEPAQHEAPKPPKPSQGSERPPSAPRALLESEPTSKQRRSVPTLESVGNGVTQAKTPKAPASKPLAATPLEKNLTLKEGPGLVPPKASAPTTELAPEEAPIGVVRLSSEIPTSRPPDVVLAGGALAASASPVSPASVRPVVRESRPPQLALTAPAPNQVKALGQLPSIMLAADVEAEPDISARRALRAGRATVRIELPADFGRPGSPLSPHFPPPGVASAAVPGSVPQAPAAPALLDSLQSRKVLWVVGGLLLAALLIFAFRPRSGSLVVTALGPGNRAVNDVTIFIDGKPLCDTSPCRIKGLTTGVHSLRATAPDLASQAEETVEIAAGEEATYNIDLLAAAPEIKAGALRIGAGASDLTLYVDGKRVGKLPQEVSGLAAGKHWIKLDPADGTAAIEKTVNVIPGETVDVEPKAAKRDKALVTIRLAPGSEGASVTLDDAFLLDFPAELELDPNSAHTLSATKPGFEDFSMQVQVEEGESEKLVEVTLSPIEGAAAPRKPRAKSTRKVAATKAAASLDATQGLLNISSVPPSQIILNGRPLGSTPKTSIAVPGDSLQTIVFVHPKMGRRRAQKFVPAGKERTVAIRF